MTDSHSKHRSSKPLSRLAASAHPIKPSLQLHQLRLPLANSKHHRRQIHFRKPINHKASAASAHRNRPTLPHSRHPRSTSTLVAPLHRQTPTVVHLLRLLSVATPLLSPPLPTVLYLLAQVQVAILRTCLESALRSRLAQACLAELNPHRQQAVKV